MDKREKIESILKAVETKLEEFFDVESGIDSSIEYENLLIEVGQFVDKQIIQATQSDFPKGRNEKKILTTRGEVVVCKRHALCKGTGKFGISCKMKEIMVYLGQTVVYEDASEAILMAYNIEVPAMQIQRLCTHYGSKIEPLIQKSCEAAISKIKNVSKQDHVYVMVDGSMVLTREESWKEVKLGRVFNESDIVQLSCKRKEVRQSVYVNHLGNVGTFFNKLERHLTPYRHNKKVIIGDGAKWIWNWAEDNYPGSTQILDFYHAKEKLVNISKLFIPHDIARKEWIDKQCDRLKENKFEQVLQQIRLLRSSVKEAKLEKEKVLNYYNEHEDRMQYKTYLDKNLLIGSGPIESAHRSVLQQRLKLSGQKWSKQGAQAIADIRCLKLSNNWPFIQFLLKTA